MEIFFFRFYPPLVFISARPDFSLLQTATFLSISLGCIHKSSCNNLMVILKPGCLN